MATKKVGELIKEARTGAGLTQEKLGAAVGLPASDISKAERGEMVLTDAALKKIAKATGVTQASLLNAPKPKINASSTKTTTAKTAAKTTAKSTGTKTTTAKTTAKSTGTKTTTAKTTTAKTTAAKSTKTTAVKTTTPAGATTSMKVTATEKKLIEYYRAASSDEKKAATKVLKGECSDLLTSIIGGTSTKGSDKVADLIGDMIGGFLGNK